MQIAITGATGYIGRWVTDAALERGHNIFLTVRAASDVSRYAGRPGVEIARDGADDEMERLAGFSPDCGIHIAAAMPKGDSMRAEQEIFEANILFPARWLRRVMDAGGKTLINTATYWEQSDKAPHGPINPYAASKAAFRAIIDGYAQQGRLSAISLRLFDVYGPCDKRPKIFNLAMAAADRGQKLDMSPGDQILHFVHARDVAKAYVIALEQSAQMAPGTHDLFDIRGNGTSLKNAIAILQHKLDKPLDVAWGALTYSRDQIMTPQLFDTLPGWLPDQSLEDGLSEIVRLHAEKKD